MGDYLGFKPPCMCGLDYPKQWWDIVPRRTAMWRKQAELLHFQLVRKARLRDYYYFLLPPDTNAGAQLSGGLFGSQPIKAEYKKLGSTGLNAATFYHPEIEANVYVPAMYNIKSDSTRPYDYDSMDDLGLNQYFVGQSPYEEYDGDPGDDDGIYHDTCEIHHRGREVKYEGGKLRELFVESPALPVRFTAVKGWGDLDPKNPEDLEKIKEIQANPHETIATKIIYKSIDEIEQTYSTSDSGTTTAKGMRFYALLACENGSVIAITGVEFEDKISQYSAREFLTFYADDEANYHYPTNLKLFAEQWDYYFALKVEEDQEEWFDYVMMALTVVMFYFTAGSLSTITSAFGQGLWAGLKAVGTGLGYVSASLQVLGTWMGDRSLMRLAQAIGFVGTIFNLAGSLGKMVSTTSNATLAANSSLLSSQGTAAKMGLNLTSQNYISTGAMNASGIGASSQMTFSELLKTGDMSFADALKTDIIGIESSGWDSVLETLKTSYKAYSDSKEIFKRADDFSDDEIPKNEDEGHAIAMKFNGNFEIGTKYSSYGEPDLGLMEGSIMYLRSQLQTKQEPINIGGDFTAIAQSKKLPLVKIPLLKLKKRKPQII